MIYLLCSAVLIFIINIVISIYIQDYGDILGWLSAIFMALSCISLHINRG